MIQYGRADSPASSYAHAILPAHRESSVKRQDARRVSILRPRPGSVLSWPSRAVDLESRSTTHMPESRRADAFRKLPRLRALAALVVSHVLILTATWLKGSNVRPKQA